VAPTSGGAGGVVLVVAAGFTIFLITLVAT